MLKKIDTPSTTLAGLIKRAALLRFAVGFGVFLLFGCETTRNDKSGFDRLLDSVARIDVRETVFVSGAERQTVGVGSGVIVSEDGVILTNAHVIGPKAVDIWVTLANLERVPARFIGWDHWTDLAAIQLDMEVIAEKGFSFAHAGFGDSDKLKAGQTVFAVGTPHGLARTVTKGIISNPNRFYFDSAGIRGYETGYFNTWLQTDAAINPGNSGGPLVDESGFIVGINTRTYLGADNLGFAIPATTAKAVLGELLEEGIVKRSYIGLSPGVLQDLEGHYSLEANTGLLVNSIDPGSPAATAGIRAGDVVLSIDGDALDGRFPEQIPPIRNKIASYPIGASLSLELKRGADTITVSVITEELLSRVGEEWAFEEWGLSVRDVSRAYARENQLESDGGVIVLGSQAAFPADRAGLRRGDVIAKVDSSELHGLEQLKAIYDDYLEEPNAVLMETLRNRNVSFKVLKP